MRIHARLEEEPVPAASDAGGNGAGQGEQRDRGDTRIYKTVAGASAPAAPAFKLVVIDGPDAGRSFLLGPGKRVLGRQPACDFLLTDDQVSRQHCQVEETHDRVMLTDLGSRNGTIVNGNRVERTFLHPGDRMQVGRTVLELQVS
jgi:hypothetical protein